MSLIDSHCHLNYKGLIEEQDNVLARARADIEHRVSRPDDVRAERESHSREGFNRRRGNGVKPCFRVPRQHTCGAAGGEEGRMAHAGCLPGNLAREAGRPMIL